MFTALNYCSKHLIDVLFLIFRLARHIILITK